MARDWLNSLFPASYRGVPFQVASDDEEGSRRIVVHEFPLRDDPFLEDLGEGARYFEVTAYLATDFADSQAAALSAALSTKGAGVLVLPAHGPIQARCLEWKRTREKDRHGYIAYAARFVREGAAFAIASVPFLANAVFVAVQALSGLLASTTRNRVALLGQPDHVVQDTAEAFENGLARFDMMRAEAAVSPDVSQTAARQIASFFARSDDIVSASTGLDAAMPDQVITLALDMGEAMEPDSAERTFSRFLKEPVETPSPATTIGAATAQANTAEMDRLFRSAALAAYAEAVTRKTFASRPEGLTVRAEAAEFFDAAMGQAEGAENADLYVALQEARGAVIEYLSRAIVDLAPVVKIEAPRQMPSLWWSYRLYGTPDRAGEIVQRNATPHPSFMAVNLEALAS